MARSTELLEIAIERGYLSVDRAEQIAEEAARRGCVPEQLLIEWRVLSVRRIERLRLHQRYRVTRKNDKAYAKLAVRWGWIDVRAVKAGLAIQRSAFEQKRECVRFGALMIEKGLLSDEQDRSLRTAVSSRQTIVPPGPQQEDDSAATLALHESSVSAGSGSPTYRALEAALERVEAIRQITQDLSVSGPALQRGGAPSADSAEELENACSVLARKRVGADLPRQPGRRKAKKKSTATSTGKFLATLLGSRGASKIAS